MLETVRMRTLLAMGNGGRGQDADLPILISMINGGNEHGKSNNENDR